MKTLKYLTLSLFLALALSFQSRAESFSLISWNIQDFGKTKSDDEIRFIAKVVNGYDIVAIQEVVSGYGGAQAVARLADQLSRMGNKWDYRISDPTNSPPYKTERYAFLWKPGKVMMIGRPWLEKSLEDAVFREPFLARFRIGKKEVIIFNYHSRRFDEKPEEEVVHFASAAALYAPTPVIIAGDFNLSESHKVFDSWKKRGIIPVLNNQPTTLKRDCSNNGGKYLNHAIDNIFYPKEKLVLMEGGVVDFVKTCSKLEEMRKISDHLGVMGRFGFR